MKNFFRKPTKILEKNDRKKFWKKMIENNIEKMLEKTISKQTTNNGIKLITYIRQTCLIDPLIKEN